MKKLVKMPALSPTMESGKLVRWLVSPGGPVKEGDILAEVETDKATMDLEAFEDGIILAFLVKDGQENIPVNSPIAEIDVIGSNDPEIPSNNAAFSQSVDPRPIVSPCVDTALLCKDDKLSVLPDKLARVLASPVARKVAREQSIDLSNVVGSGPGGRIVKSDLSHSIAKSSGVFGPTDTRHANTKSNVPDRTSWLEDISNMRKTIATRLFESKRDIPHFYLNIECDATSLLSIRKKINEFSELKVTVNDLIVKAVAMSMRDVKEINCSWENGKIRRYNYIDICIAVAIEGGLVTPIIFNVDKKTLTQVASDTRSVISRARDKKLGPKDYEGGNFTISNLGMFGIKDFCAIINPPQSCILAIGEISKQPGFDADGKLVTINRLVCTLSVDHRAVDGSIAANFLSRFKAYIQDPIIMLC